MSDLSDDTNHLLLIPPDFFMADLANVSSSDGDIGSSVSKHLPYVHAPFTSPETRRHPTGAAAYGSAPRQSFAIGHGIPTTADSSFRSYCPVNGMGHATSGTGNNGASMMFQHSTPKAGPIESTVVAAVSAKTPSTVMRPEDSAVIFEIDRFLHERRPGPQKNSTNNSTEETLRELRSKGTLNGDAEPASSAGVRNGRNLFRPQTQTGAVADEPLLSLSSMWGTDVAQQQQQQGNNVAALLEEERLRRRHCEHTIQQLQQTLLDREQRVAVALRVDSRKNEAIDKMRADHAAAVANANALQQSLDRAVQRFADEHQLLDGRCAQLQRDNERLQRELAQAQVAQRHLHECNELLEQKIRHVGQTTAEVRSMHQQQIAELEVRVRNGARNEELAAAEVAKLREANERLQAEATRAESCSKQTEQQWLLKEKTLHEELATQRASLKTVYQEQLNEAVARKLADFQAQVDTVEATLRSEGRQRERLIAERALRQLELIVQKNEQECALLSEKYNTEIELYRIQLINAAKTNETLTQKVDAFRAKRTDMAERLHNVMETQWHRALEIIASPTAHETKAAAAAKPHKSNGTATAANDAPVESTLTRAESDSFHTPKSAKVPGEKGTNDALQHYIDMLLEKSPREYDNFADMLSIRTGKKPAPMNGNNGSEHRKSAGNRVSK